MGDLIGQSIGRYHILEQLGEGGMATVYKAYDTHLERDVAVKIIRVDQFPPAALEKILKRFEREAKALAKLSHPNIVGVIDYGEHEGVPYLVMVYLLGGTLKEKLGRPMHWTEATRLLLPVAHALAYAHRQGVIHRDVKPNNILMAHSGDPMLTDFGIAKILDIGGDGQTNFKLPDLRGRLPMHRGSGNTVGQYGGQETVALQANQVAAHTHTLRAKDGAGDKNTPSTFWHK